MEKELLSQLMLTPEEIKRLKELVRSNKLMDALYPETIVNLTPHDVVVYDVDGSVLKTIPASGNLARARENKEAVERICGVPILQAKDPTVEGMPEPITNTYYIVSRVVANLLKHRKDVLVVDMQVKDDTGRVIGCRGLTRV